MKTAQLILIITLTLSSAALALGAGAVLVYALVTPAPELPAVVVPEVKTPDKGPGSYCSVWRCPEKTQ